jgi:hypothetical protein
VEVEVETTGEGVKGGLSVIRRSLPPSIRNVAPHPVKIGTVKAVGEVEIEWSWKSVD